MTQPTASTPALSVVVCCYNEAKNLVPLFERLLPAIAKRYAESYEIVLIDDGSSDETWQTIEAHTEQNPRIVGAKLARNFGQQAALTAGLELATGDRILILDADLQDPPELLEKMSEALDQGADIAFGKRSIRNGETAFKKISANLFYKLLNFLSETPVHQGVGDFRLITRQTLDTYLSLPEPHRFSRGLFSWLGGKQVPIEFEREPRFAGSSQYTLRKMIALASDAITGFSVAPLRVCGALGLISFSISLLLFLYIAISYFFLGTTRGWTSMAAIVTFFGSVQLLSLSIIGEYIGRIYLQGKARPIYVVSKTLNATQAKPASLGHIPQNSFKHTHS